jgi:hypothetical protein
MRQKLKRFGLGMVNLAALTVVVRWLYARVGRNSFAGMPSLAMAAVLIALYWAGSRWIERRRAEEVRLQDLAKGLGAGLALGVAVISCVMGVLLIIGFYRPAGWGPWVPLAGALVSSIADAVSEEIFFRGFLFRVVAVLGGKWTALAISSAIFGFAHYNNAGASVWSSVAIAIEAGGLLGAAYSASGSLWLPIGIHAGWNFAEGPIFGTAVSGYTEYAGWVTGSLRGPDLLTGGAFGPEASIVTPVVCLALAAYYLRKMARARSTTEPDGAEAGTPQSQTPA